MPAKNVMHEFKHGTLHSGSKKGPKVKSRQQAIAIMMSEQRQEKSMAKKGMMRAPRTKEEADEWLRYGDPS